MAVVVVGGGGGGFRLKMCEEALSNQVKEKEKKKKASWETDVNNGPGNGRSKLRSRAPVCFYTHPGLAIKHARVALQREGVGAGGRLARGSAESGYVPSWGSRATIPMFGKGVRYSTVYQEKGQTARKKKKKACHIRGDARYPGAVSLNTDCACLQRNPFLAFLGLRRRNKHNARHRKALAGMSWPAVCGFCDEVPFTQQCDITGLPKKRRRVGLLPGQQNTLSRDESGCRTQYLQHSICSEIKRGLAAFLAPN